MALTQFHSDDDLVRFAPSPPGRALPAWCYDLPADPEPPRPGERPDNHPGTRPARAAARPDIRPASPAHPGARRGTRPSGRDGVPAMSNSELAQALRGYSRTRRRWLCSAPELRPFFQALDALPYAIPFAALTALAHYLGY